NTVFSEDNYRDYWDNLRRKKPRNENNLFSVWEQAAEHESRRRWRRFLLIVVVLLGLLCGIVGEQLGWWSRRAVYNHAVETVRQRIGLISGSVAVPEAGGGGDQGRPVAPLARRALPTAIPGSERINVGTAVPPVSQESVRALTPPTQLPTMAS